MYPFVYCTTAVALTLSLALTLALALSLAQTIPRIGEHCVYLEQVGTSPDHNPSLEWQAHDGLPYGAVLVGPGGCLTLTLTLTLTLISNPDPNAKYRVHFVN